jgi:hypothetical protein
MPRTSAPAIFPVAVYRQQIDAELWEIAENLHRSELTALEHDVQVSARAPLGYFSAVSLRLLADTRRYVPVWSTVPVDPRKYRAQARLPSPLCGDSTRLETHQRFAVSAVTMASAQNIAFMVSPPAIQNLREEPPFPNPRSLVAPLSRVQATTKSRTASDALRPSLRSGRQVFLGVRGGCEFQ